MELDACEVNLLTSASTQALAQHCNNLSVYVIVLFYYLFVVMQYYACAVAYYPGPHLRVVLDLMALV